MQMKLDRERIRLERTQRAWSQEHLAEVSGLGLRTVQRIEATGLASRESAMALAAVLDLSVAALLVEEAAVSTSRSWLPTSTRLASATALSIMAVLALFAFRSSFAEQILLDVGLSLSDDSQVVKTKMAIEDGESGELEFEDLARFVITPETTENGLIMISIEVFEFDGSEYVKTREPRVLTEDGRAAEIALGRSEAETIRMSFTPERQ